MSLMKMMDDEKQARSTDNVQSKRMSPLALLQLTSHTYFVFEVTAILTFCNQTLKRRVEILFEKDENN